jgi:hypothetical protein
MDLMFDPSLPTHSIDIQADQADNRQKIFLTPFG